MTFDRFVPIALGATGLALILSTCAHDADAHDAPSGWTYPMACCSDFDCREVGDADVTEAADGYRVPSGEILAYQDRRVRPSPDGRFHWCSVAGSMTGKTICLFAPPRSF